MVQLQYVCGSVRLRSAHLKRVFKSGKQTWAGLFGHHTNPLGDNLLLMCRGYFQYCCKKCVKYYQRVILISIKTCAEYPQKQQFWFSDLFQDLKVQQTFNVQWYVLYISNTLSCRSFHTTNVGERKQIYMNYIHYIFIHPMVLKTQSQAVDYHRQSLHSNSATHHKTS